MSKIILFTHIPKTAGTSFFKSVIKQNISESGILMPNGRYSAILRCNSRDIRFVGGHIKFGLHRFILKKCVYLTFLREPISRFISDYYFVLESNYPGYYKHPLYDVCSKNDMPDILKLGYIKDNLQVRYLTGLTDEKVDHRALKEAKKNLEKYYPIFGIKENYKESLKKILAFYNWKYESNEIQEKVTKNKPLISDEVTKYLEKYHMYDLELYDFALRRFSSL